MKRIVFLLFFIITQWSLAQKIVKSNSYKISYNKSSNGKLIENQDAIVIFTNEDQTVLTLNSIVNGNATFPFEQTIINRVTKNYSQIAQLDKTKTAKTIDSVSIAKQNFEISNDFKTILGYKCQKAKP